MTRVEKAVDDLKAAERRVHEALLELVGAHRERLDATRELHLALAEPGKD